MMLNLCFYITLGTLFIWAIRITKYRLLILSLSAIYSYGRTDRMDFDENKFCLLIDIPYPKKTMH